MTARYRRKRGEVDAVQFTEAVRSLGEVLAFGEGFVREALTSRGSPSVLMVTTLHGDVFVHHGEWIIKGGPGDFSPCKPDVFEASYEPASTGERGGDALDVDAIAAAIRFELDHCGNEMACARRIVRDLGRGYFRASGERSPRAGTPASASPRVVGALDSIGAVLTRITEYGWKPTTIPAASVWRKALLDHALAAFATLADWTPREGMTAEEADAEWAALVIPPSPPPRSSGTTASDSNPSSSKEE